MPASDFEEKARQLIQSAKDGDKFVNRLEQEPYGEPGFEALQNFAMQAGKTLFLANGGAAVALLTLLGASMQTKDPIIGLNSLWFIVPATIFGIGILCSVLLYALAMISQKHFNEPIKISEDKPNLKKIAQNLKEGKKYQNWSKKSGLTSAAMFIAGIFVWVIILA
ncbi:hypothetical protein [Maridesulfovibrio sp.]|uniref:hypothetical protein n=1 Tax=Maridesulfovibrio sp. TaxID=2795000 RepID=UPI002A18A715|nr:hypothetical protein [Maridesulfovibrio sp.]